jgi:2,3-bisphosphoglycerate-independent phosphoglycerate mutase
MIKMQPLVLCILDGVGIRNEKHGNAFSMAKKPNFDFLWNKYPHSLLEASGELVGLPHGQMGNSEVGHMNIGAGRVVYQPLQLINEKIKNKEFYDNKEYLSVIDYVNKNNSKLHIFGLLSDGGIHSHINHLFAIMDMAKQNGIKKLYLHMFLDGRDTLPDVAEKYLDMLSTKINELDLGVIATISGRYYAMDRDNRWERVILAYNAITKAEGPKYDNYSDAIKSSYDKKIYDEFVLPTVIDSDGIVEENDGLILFNYRPDRGRELFSALTNPIFSGFQRPFINNLKLVTMMPLSNEVINTTAFDNQNLSNTLGEYLANNNKKQLRIAETEKYAHVTYFFDGGLEKELRGCDRILVPSPKVATYDLKPEMSAVEITNRLLEVVDDYDVIIVNYANGDMVGHTGIIPAAISAVECIDECLGRLYQKVEELGGTLLVTADHGNCDWMLDDNENVITSHSTSLVPFIINKNIELKNGKLADIAPTILKILNLEIPKEMTGNILINNNENN